MKKCEPNSHALHESYPWSAPGRNPSAQGSLNRQSAIARIWPAVQRLSLDGAEPAADVAPAREKTKSAKMYPAYWWSKLLATMRIRARPSFIRRLGRQATISQRLMPKTRFNGENPM